MPRRRRAWSPIRRAEPSAATHSDATSRPRVWRTLENDAPPGAAAPEYCWGVEGGGGGSGGPVGRGGAAPPTCGAAVCPTARGAVGEAGGGGGGLEVAAVAGAGAR